MRVFILLFFLLISMCSFAQLDNSAFYDEMPIDSTKDKELYFRFHNLNFTKNNEYFNKISDGYTLFGVQLSPQLSYQPHKFIRIDAGVYLWKDFGNNNYSQIAPLYTIQFQKKKHRLLMGTIQGNLNHRYIEPLFDFERVMVNRLENGLQYLNTGKRYFFDAWINYENMLYEMEDDQEKISGGISSYYDVVQKEKFVVQIPLQTVLMHTGGQIDTSPLQIVSLLNASAGLSLEYKHSKEGFLRSVKFDNYWAYFYDFSFTKVQSFPYTEGNGFYSNLFIRTKVQDFMISYWQGNDFISIQGGQLYPSLSSNVKQRGYTENDRKLFILRFMKDVHIHEQIYLTLRFEPHWDILNQKFEFSHGLYINFKASYKITNLDNRQK